MMALIAQLLRPYRRHLLVALTAMLVQAGMSVAAPWPLKVVIDRVTLNHTDPQWVQRFLTWIGVANNTTHVAALAAAIVVMIAILGAIANYINIYFTGTIGQWVANDLRIRTYHHLQQLSLKYHHTHQVGTLISTITDDVTTIQGFASQSIVNMLVDILTITGMLAVMFALRWDFALVAVAVLPFLILFVSHVRSAIQKATKEARKRQAEIVAAAQEGLQSVEAVEAFQREDLEEHKLAEISKAAVEATLKARRVRALLSPVVTVPIACCSAFVLWRGSSLVVHGAMTAGSLTVFTAYLLKFFQPVQDLSGQADTIAQTSVAVERIRDILDADDVIQDRPDARDAPPFRGEIVIDHVAFRYDQQDRPVLRDVSFAVEPGQLVGIVGATGSGKSTLVSLIPRFYDADAGTITIDGADVRSFKVHDVRSQIGFVLQETILFRGSVRDNIAFGRPDATEDEVVEAAKLANADDFITQMRHGYESLVGERGMTLSGGQRQRIGIARALIRDNPILILDEATAALDAHSENAVIEALERLMKGRTVFCIAHRLSTIRSAHKIIAIKDGVVAEQGTHEELLVIDGVYAELHRLQFKGQSA
jgi:ABC-type multidrug transport system fused ATPase/permease subunit